MDFLWAGMLICGMIYAAFSGNLEAVTEIILSSAKEAVQLGIGMAGVLAFWTGLMEIAGKTGLISQLTSGIGPVIRWLFPDIPEGHEAREHITANVIANILGLGWAATPSGLKAMEALAKLEEDRRSGSRYPGQPQGRPKGTASNEMCNFLILNISSLQLIPVNIIAYRSQYGSVCPTAVVGPAIAATAVSTAAAILFFKIADRRSRL